MNPVMVGSDLTIGQNATGGFTPIISLSMSQGSATGESSWGISSMIWGDLKSFALSANKSDMNFKNGALKSIDAYSYTVAYVAGTHMTFGGYTHIIPHPKLGTFGYNLSVINIKLKGIISLLNPPPVELEGLVRGETLQAKSDEIIVRAESETTIYYSITTEYQVFHALEDFKKSI